MSDVLDIFTVNNVSDNIESWDLSAVYKKCFIISMQNMKISLPLIHSGLKP